MTTAYLTIDDAPSAALPEKLDLLQDEDVPALFFCEGRRLDAHLDHAVAAIEAGYHLGNHAYSHTHAEELSVETFREEVQRTEELIEEAYERAGVDRPAKVFRFPYGDRGAGEGAAEDRTAAEAEKVEQLQSVLADAGFSAIDPGALVDHWDAERAAEGLDWGWTVHFSDWDKDVPAELREAIDAERDRLTGDGPELLLFHDDGTAIELFEVLLAYADDAGIEFADPMDVVAR